MTKIKCHICHLDTPGGGLENDRCELHASVYAIAAHLKPDLDKALAKWRRKAKHIGTEPIGYTVVKEHSAPVYERGKIVPGVTKPFIIIKLTGQAPRVHGYEFLARLEHHDVGNLISKAPAVRDAVISEHFRTAPARCSHCAKTRKRNDTFLLRELSTGAIQQIGRNCLADYIRSEDAAEAIRMWKFIDDVEKLAERSGEEESEGGGGWGGSYAISTERFVAVAFRAYNRHGWAPSSFDNSTVSMARFGANKAPNRDRGEDVYAAWLELQPTPREEEQARLAIDWAKSREVKSDYDHNLYVAASLPVTSHKREGILASLTKAYTEAMGREVERQKSREKAKAAGGHFGGVKRKYVRRLAVKLVRSIESPWGLSRLYLLEDAEGRRFKWFASGGDDFPLPAGLSSQQQYEMSRRLEVGDEGWFSFTVKSHDEYQGIPETVISRAGMLGVGVEPAQAFKWIGADSEIFKSKKDMLGSSPAAPKPRQLEIDPFAQFERS